MSDKRDTYLAKFSGESRTGRQAEALKHALDIRKFEIELYWKRATYFWAFIAVAFGAFFVSQKDGDMGTTFVISCLGLIFSLSWYLVNRASAYWQRNWERHVDLLEDEVMGPLHKMTIERKSFPFSDLTGPYRYSPSRINTLLALATMLVWILLIARTLSRWEFKPLYSPTIAFMSLLTIGVVFAILRTGKSSRRLGVSRWIEFRERNLR
jgi:hypothetical protein